MSPVFNWKHSHYSKGLIFNIKYCVSVGRLKQNRCLKEMGGIYELYVFNPSLLRPLIGQKDVNRKRQTGGRHRQTETDVTSRVAALYNSSISKHTHPWTHTSSDEQSS